MNLIYDWSTMLYDRYTQLSKLIDIEKTQGKFAQEKSTIVGLLYDKQITKNGHLKITLEDPSGLHTVIITKANKILKDIQKLPLDIVIGITGDKSNDALFGQHLHLPKIPSTPWPKQDGYVLFTSDIELGSKNFLQDNWNNFIEWTRGKQIHNNPQIQDQTKKIYLVGDVVAGINVYPGQKNELEITDLYQQYQRLAQDLKKIPHELVIIPGNHDAVSIAEPQTFTTPYTECLQELPNTILRPSPYMEDLNGLKIFLYHGQSLAYLTHPNSPDIHTCIQYGHCNPTYGQTQLKSNPTKDPLLVTQTPHITATGHLHKTTVQTNPIALNCSCWTSQTDHQKKMGITPQPAKILAVNLQTQEVIILEF